MARTFVRLKLALMGGAWRKGIAFGFLQVFGILMAVNAATFGILAAVVLAPRVDARVTAATVAALGWTVGPALSVGLDETLDPARLALLPLPRRTLAVGLGIASAVGAGGVATLLPMVAFGVLGAGGPVTAVLGIVAGVVQLAVCILLGRTTATAVARLVRTRRGQDAFSLVAGLAGLAIAGLAQIPGMVAGSGLDLGDAARLLGRADDLLVWFPGAWPMATVAAADAGRVLPAVAFAAGTAGLVAGLAAVWGRLITASFADPGSSTAARSRTRPLMGGMGGVGRLLPAGPVGAAAARELTYAFGSPQRRISTLLLVVSAVVPPVAVTIVDALDDPLAVLLAGVPAVFGVLIAVNQFQVDAAGVWQFLVVPGGAAAELRGKVLGQAVLTLPCVVVSATALALLTGGGAVAAVVLPAAVALFMVGTGTGQVASVLVPLPQPDATTNAFASGSGAGCLQAIAFTVGLGGTGLALVPVLVAVGWSVAGGLAAWPVVAVGALAYAALVWWGTHRVAVGLLDRHPDRFLARIEAALP